MPRSTFYKHSLSELKKLNLLTNDLFGLEFISFDYDLKKRQPSLARHPKISIFEKSDFVVMTVEKNEKR